MSLFKSLVDKVQQTKDDLGEKAAEKKRELERKAAQKAAEAALKRGAETAKAALVGAGKRIEEALFGEDEPDPKPEERKSSLRDGLATPVRPPRRLDDDQPKKPAPTTPSRDRVASDPAAAAARQDREIDDELAALKRKLGKPK